MARKQPEQKLCIQILQIRASFISVEVRNFFIYTLNSQVPSVTEKRWEGGQSLPSLLDSSACFSH